MSLFAPLRIRAFRRLLAAYSVCALGSWLGDIALMAVAFHQTGSALAVAAVLAAGQFAPALLGPSLLVRAERLPTHAALSLLLVVQALMLAGLAAAVAAGLPLAAILALATVDGVAGLAARALAKAAAAAVTEPRGLLREGNAIITAAFTACMALGPILAGGVVAMLSPQLALVLDAAAFAVAALLLGVRSALPRISPEAADRRGVRSALAVVRDQPGLRRLFSAYTVMVVLAAAILPVEIVLVTETLGADMAAFGLVMALWGIGAAVGGCMLALLRRAPLTLLVAGSFALYALAYLGMGTAGSIGVAAGFSFLGGIANGIEAYAVLTAVQLRTAPALQARVGSLLESVSTGALGLGFLCGGALTLALSPRAVYVIAGVGILAAALALVTPSIRTTNRSIITNYKETPMRLASKWRRVLPGHAVIVAYLALFVALGGTSYAAIVVTGKNVKDGSLTGKDIKDRSLRAKHFAKGQLPAGARGAAGRQGQPGAQGPRGQQGPQGQQGPAGEPRAYAYVLADGSVDETRSKGITDANVSHPYVEAYCFKGLGFTPKSVIATAEVGTAGSGSLDRFAQGALPFNAQVHTPCAFGGSPDWQAAVAIHEDGAAVSHPFYVVLN